ncbi:amidase family protein [Promicromonospora thailandica]|uniref:Asp-tRNAAsn/Glu-tRNAGln amidotransferase A subunit n=1 Tax=Promicromonospora thailandica TaxID=765201 RepID=A0A9X2G2B6_9MICO|nr:amidase family protein [Promicromonospora thailandica]MCP2264163.1 Asp-tRNAAsn/Glu-tRNAGln amidotransferase A subunit [Promicromonospora thailandica]BFF21169.1 amidase [Promicromonospora thailandica]
MAPDPRVWRVRPEPGPLVAPSRPGVLDGETVAVKDLFAVTGQRVGAGNPAWLAAAPVERAHADAVARLLAAGAAVAGIARTEEFAYSLTGANAHYGTPPNPRAPGRISGGSTSGPATAVAAGEASVGLGTDTGGSVRVPAAYQGLWGMRPTHGAVPADGVLPLAPTFDTVGWLARDAGTLARVGDVLLPRDEEPLPEAATLVTSDALLALATPEVRAAVGRFAADAGAEPVDWAPEPDLLAAFQTLQAAEAWAVHGAWLDGRADTLGPAVRDRFERARAVGADDAEAARTAVARARAEIRERLGQRVLVLPSAASVAPRPEEAEQVRTATMLLTCVAGIGGLPAVSVPVATAGGLPAGACLVGLAGSDRSLLALAGRLAG